ncbi:hypothetical protein [Gloeocapsa sp. PCC 73106]|uniref:hypothetical protein n=1 Tax=Gloeocapsa sp. PCC 73106 TaxID=102232 RepID=UPI0002ACC75B|nr:hypothetical protein [Gloeocapsa sp. PCC 73106]ELR97610.1 hypothetical protein GLO73106DRAFT_00014220 [Gloeocapsa sp. PCC 73106]
MKIIQTKGIIKDRELKVIISEEISNGEVDVIIISKNELDDFERRHQLMIKKGYDTPEKVVELIRQIKVEMLKEKGRS